MTFEESMAYLDHCQIFKKKNDLDDLTKVSARLGSPEKSLAIIHVAGTNGKGSVCAMAASMLRSAGYRTGLYTSPHLSIINERFRLNGEMISDDELAAVLTEVRAAAGDLDLTYSAALTLSAFLWFKKSGAEAVALETGMGGRLDATNIVPEPAVCAITSIGFDHMAWLGSTIESILFEKAGIIKKNSPLVLYLAPDTVYNTVKEICGYRGASFVCDRDADVRIASRSLSGISIDVDSERFKLRGLNVGLPGDFQAYNALTALEIIGALNERGFNVSEAAMRDGLSRAAWPSRMEYFPLKPAVLLDGAHNADAAAALAASLKPMDLKSVTSVVGMMKDKDLRGIVSALSECSDRFIFTKAPYGRSANPQQLKSLAPKSEAVNDPIKALEYAMSQTPEDGLVLVCGSLYLTGLARDYLSNR